MKNTLRSSGKTLQKVLLLICLTYSSLPLFAFYPPGKYQVKGAITEAESGKSVPYATITVQNAKGIVKKLASDVNGKFVFALDSVGKYVVLVQSIGFQTYRNMLTIEAKNLKVDLGTIKLQTGSEKLGEVEVVAQKPLVRTEVDKIVYSIEADPEAKTTNALEMLRKIPLVTVDGEDNIQVKGASNFKILLNGKNSSMLSQNPKDVLRSLPANTIKDIEVITNPSSKYEAEGTGGIINIITTKKQLDGIMGRVNAGVDSRGGYSGGLYATSKIKKFGFSANYSYNEFLQPTNENYSDRENLLSTTNRFSKSSGFNKFKGASQMAMGEASYEIDSLNLVSLSFWGYTGDYTSTGEQTTSDWDVNNTLTRQLRNLSSSTNGRGSLSGNIDYQRTYKKPDKTFTVSYKLDRSPMNTEGENDIEGILNYNSYRQRSNNDASGTEHTFQLDYYDPLTKMHQMECGVKYILRQNLSNSSILRYDATQDEWIQDITRNNRLDYDQHIFGVYAGYVIKLKKVSIKTGLRAEGTVNDGHYSSVRDTTFKNRLFNIIPYVTLSKNMNNGQNVKLSYTQRLSRPSIYYLNPYVNDMDPLNINYGNPNLDAEVSHTFDLSYGRFSNKYNINLSLNGSLTNNSIVSLQTINASGVKTTTYKNIGKNQSFGSYLYGSLRPNNKLTIGTNIGIRYTLLESNDGRNLKNEGFSYNGSFNVRYTLWKNGSVSGYGGVYSPSIMLQGKSSMFWYTNLNVSQELFKKKFTATLSVTDPFRSEVKYKSTINDPTFHQESTYLYSNRMVRVNLSYRFGQVKGEIKKAKRGIKNDDVKSGSSGTGEGTQQN